MGVRRTRATSRREESPEQPPEGPVTRSSFKRAEISDASPQSKPTHQQPKFPQRGIRRRHRRSVESVATDDFPSSSVGYASPERPSMGPPESLNVEDMVASDAESQDDSFEDRAARLQDILDFDLPKLSRWCEKAYEALSSLSHPEPTIGERKKLNRARKSFETARHVLAEDGAAYIDLSSSDLPYREDPDAHAVIQKVALSANSISLLLSLDDLKRPKLPVVPFLQELDYGFLTLLDSDLSAQLESHALGFRVRCAWLAELLTAEPHIDPLILATLVFCEEAANTSEEATQRLRKGPFRSFSSTEKSRDFTSSKQFKTQMDEIIANLSLPERAEIEQSLIEMFPRNEVLERLRAWALDMYESMNKKADKIDLPPNDQNGGGANDGAELEESSGLFVSGNNEPDKGSDSEPSSEHGDYNQLKMAKEPSFIQDLAALAAVRRSERGGSRHPTIEPRPSRKTAKGKLTDSQTIDAIRRLKPAEILGSSDSGDENGDGTVYPGAGAADSRSRSRSRSNSQELGAAEKRAHSLGGDDYVDQNDGFEVDERSVDESRRNQYEGSTAPGPVPKRSRFSRNFSKNRDRPQSPENTPAATNLTEEDLATLSRAARANRLANKGRGHQTRERWSDVDTDHLLDLIANQSLSCSWSKMQAEGGFQTYRNQQAIRDKARNLKKGYLCADAILPTGFDFVRLSKKERNDVIASGRNPDRMEDDIDEHGRVIRHLWRGDPS